MWKLKIIFACGVFPSYGEDIHGVKDLRCLSAALTAQCHKVVFAQNRTVENILRGISQHQDIAQNQEDSEEKTWTFYFGNFRTNEIRRQQVRNSQTLWFEVKIKSSYFVENAV